MKQSVTGVVIQVELTGTNDEGKVCWRPDKMPTFVALQSDIPDAVLEWITDRLSKGGA